jgi:hypothetical protein
MSSTILAAAAVIFILASLAAVILVCARILRKAGSRLKRLRPARHQAKISADEIIDLHLALKDVESLREIADQIPA